MVVKERALAVRDTTDLGIIEKVVVEGDLSKLSAAERLTYYSRLCDSLSLNPLTQPFEYLRLNGKLVLYAKKTATDQLRQVHGVSIVDVDSKTAGDILTVTAHARTNAGIEDVDIGAVNVKGLFGEALANAYMKALTKAKRRVTLSICGLGMLDETEVETIPGAVSDDWRERYRRRFFAVAKGTSYESEEGRAAFLARFCAANDYSPTSSLRAFLTAAAEEDAIALVAALEQAAQDAPAPERTIDADAGEIVESAAEALAADLFAVTTPEPEPNDAALAEQAERIREWWQMRVPAEKSPVVSRADAKFQFDRLTEITGTEVAAGKLLSYLKGKPGALFTGLTMAEAALLDKAVEFWTGDTLAAIVPVAKAWAAAQ